MLAVLGKMRFVMRGFDLCALSEANWISQVYANQCLVPVWERVNRCKFRCTLLDVVNHEKNVFYISTARQHMNVLQPRAVTCRKL